MEFTDKNNIYDVIIVGGGASGLFCASSFPAPVKGLILEGTSSLGKKLLMAGSGQCNFTHGGNIKNFIDRYGKNGSTIRTALYKFNNEKVIEFFSERGIDSIEREDGKVFPVSMSGKDVLNVLISSTKSNGFDIALNSKVIDITCDSPEGLFSVVDNSKKIYYSRKLILACGGASYPVTGSDGSIYKILEGIGIEIMTPTPVLTPVFVENYPFAGASGISFKSIVVTVSHSSKAQNSSIKIGSKIEKSIVGTGDLLLTHKNFSGPLILDISRYITTGNSICIDYFPGKTSEEMLKETKNNCHGNQKEVLTYLISYTSLPKSFLEICLERLSLNPHKKMASLSGNQIEKLVNIIKHDTFTVSGKGGFNIAMATSGGVSLSEVTLKTMESKKYEGLYIIGELLDIDGDTGGYNLQFAFSSAFAAASAASI